MKAALHHSIARSVVVASALVALSARADLSEALSTNLVWTTSPNFGWAEVFDTTYDNESAAQSSPVPIGESSWLRTTVTGPGQIRFFWKIYADDGYAYLRLNVGTNRLEITGDVEWEQVAFPVPAGAQTIEWIYEKIPGAAMPGDAAWLDVVEFVPGPSAPFLYRSPEGTNVLAGTPVVLNALGLGTEPLSYQWQLNNANLPGANSPVYAMPATFTNDAGNYRVIITNAYGAVTSAVATVTVDVDPLAVALNTPRLIWFTTEYAPWEPTSLASHDGVSSAQSALIGDDEDSRLSTTVTGPGELTFWWRVSCEADFDILMFATNGNYVAEISGIQPWQRYTLAIPPGPLELEWSYLKDSSGEEGDDAAWLDEVTFTPFTPPALLGPSWSGGTFRVSVATIAGRSYVLEYQNAIGAPANTNWTALPTVNGDGTVRQITDPNASATRRFYRLRQQ